MAQTRQEKLFKTLERLSTASKKEDRLKINIVKASDLADITFIPSGDDLFDAIVGGWPRGKFSLVFGGSGVGKTSFILQSIANANKLGLASLLMEPENRADKKHWAKTVDLSQLPITQCTSLGDALDSLVKIVETGDVDLVVIDSLAALAVKELKGKGTEGDHMALVARRLPQFFAMASEIVEKSKTAVVFVHQKRDVLEMYSSELETYGGGNALKHQVSLVLNIRRAATSKDPDKGERFKGANESNMGFMANVKCIKGTVGTITEGKSFQMDFMFGRGFQAAQSIALFAIRKGIIAKEGPGQYSFNRGTYSYSQRGVMNTIVDVTQDPELKKNLLESIKELMWTANAEEPTVAEVAPDKDFEKEEATRLEVEIATEETVATITPTPVIETSTQTIAEQNNGDENVIQEENATEEEDTNQATGPKKRGRKPGKKNK
jgi:recombination protein RecA